MNSRPNSTVTMRPVIFGLEALALSEAEADFFSAERPCGFILFARNIADPDQVRALVLALRRAVPGAFVLIDQEGGRVARFRPPHWPAYPPASAYGACYLRDRERGCEAAWLGARLIACDLGALGIDVDCLPLLDVPVAGAHAIIVDRAYGQDPRQVAELGLAAAEGLAAGGVLPVIKHIPGHGRAEQDSHEALPIVRADRAALAKHDFAPFGAAARLPLAMTAHVVYAAIDPDRPATLSPRVIAEVIRGEIGFDGLLMSDDLCMKALSGDRGDLTAGALAAGCDVVLHCSGDLAEMRKVAAAAPPMTGRARDRLHAAHARKASPQPEFDRDGARERLNSLLSGIA